MTSVADLLAQGRLQQVPADSSAAAARLERAAQHLTTAAGLVGQDNEVAYTSLYDAARKAVTAHMLAHGFRVTAAPGAHVGVGDYAAERVPDSTGAVRQFGRLRRRRNRSEYEDLLLGEQDVVADLAVARDIVAAVRADLTPSARVP